MVFSPDASVLGVLNGDRAWLLDAGNGALIAQFELGEMHAGIAFARSSQLFLGGNSGSLRLISKGADEKWTLRQVWTGAAPIRLLEAAPSGEFLVVVDANNLASQFVLDESRIAEATLQLPSPIVDVTFSGNRVLFRTSRWFHRASSSHRGLVWQDSVFGPTAIHGARVVGDGQRGGGRSYVPAVRNGFVELVELGFRGSSAPGLFGSREQLLDEWLPRLRGAGDSDER
jgi:hypothetical protein